MKTRITLIIAFLICLTSLAQNGINYKAIVKDDDGNTLTSLPRPYFFSKGDKRLLLIKVNGF